MRKKYNKLVRDNIPDLIRQDGKIPVVSILSDETYLSALNEKLKEEVKEYLLDGEPEELCDIIEVIYAIAAAKGISIDEIDALRRAKAVSRGAFQNRVFLESVRDDKSGKTSTD